MKYDVNTLQRPKRAVKDFEINLQNGAVVTLRLRQLGTLDGFNIESFTDQELQNLEGLGHDGEFIRVTRDACRVITTIILAQDVAAIDDMYTASELAILAHCDDGFLPGLYEASIWAMSRPESVEDGDSFGDGSPPA